jgi:hypothetical protein
MLVAELLPFVKNLAARKWSDEDILEDVNFLRDELEARFESLTCVPVSPMIAKSAINGPETERGMNMPRNFPRGISRGHRFTIRTCSGRTT